MTKFRYSFNCALYSGEPIETSVERVARCGYDAIELPGEVLQYQPRAIARLTRDAGITVSSVCGHYTADRDLSDPDESQRRQAVHYVEQLSDFAREVGAPRVIVAPQSWMRPSLPPNLEERRRFALEAIAAACEQAATCGVSLVIECWNRYEAWCLNRLDQGLAFLDDLNQPNASIMGDTFHMNIEERSISGAIHRAGLRLKHMHVADSNRCVPGDGHIDFMPVLKALREIGYEGFITVEILPPPVNSFAGLTQGSRSELYEFRTRQSIGYLRDLESRLMHPEGASSS